MRPWKTKHTLLGVSFITKVKKEIINATFLIPCAKNNKVHPTKPHPQSIALCHAIVINKKKLKGFTLLHTLNTRSQDSQMALITVINHRSLFVTITCTLSISMTITL
jgi:hypothetical protein